MMRSGDRLEEATALTGAGGDEAPPFGAAITFAVAADAAAAAAAVSSAL